MLFTVFCQSTEHMDSEVLARGCLLGTIFASFFGHSVCFFGRTVCFLGTYLLFFSTSQIWTPYVQPLAKTSHGLLCNIDIHHVAYIRVILKYCVSVYMKLLTMTYVCNMLHYMVYMCSLYWLQRGRLLITMHYFHCYEQIQFHLCHFSLSTIICNCIFLCVTVEMPHVSCTNSACIQRMLRNGVFIIAIHLILSTLNTYIELKFQPFGNVGLIFVGKKTRSSRK